MWWKTKFQIRLCSSTAWTFSFTSGHPVRIAVVINVCSTGSVAGIFLSASAFMMTRLSIEAVLRFQYPSTQLLFFHLFPQAGILQQVWPAATTQRALDVQCTYIVRTVRTIVRTVPAGYWKEIHKGFDWSWQLLWNSTATKYTNKIDASGVKRLIPCMSFCS